VRGRLASEQNLGRRRVYHVLLSPARRAVLAPGENITTFNNCADLTPEFRTTSS
jgi:hypothetical protein